MYIFLRCPVYRLCSPLLLQKGPSSMLGTFVSHISLWGKKLAADKLLEVIGSNTHAHYIVFQLYSTFPIANTMQISSLKTIYVTSVHTMQAYVCLLKSKSYCVQWDMSQKTYKGLHPKILKNITNLVLSRQLYIVSIHSIL